MAELILSSANVKDLFVLNKIIDNIYFNVKMILYYISIFVLLSHSIRDYGLFRGLVFINVSVFSFINMHKDHVMLLLWLVFIPNLLDGSNNAK